MKANIASLQQIFDKITELNRKNNLLKAKYEHDTKFARLHKRILERGNISKRESEICDNLTEIKKQVDEIVLINEQLLNNEPYFYGVVIKEIIKSFEKASVKLEAESAKYINNCLVKEYVNEYKGIVEW